MLRLAGTVKSQGSRSDLTHIVLRRDGGVERSCPVGKLVNARMEHRGGR